MFWVSQTNHPKHSPSLTSGKQDQYGGFISAQLRANIKMISMWAITY